MPAPASQEKNPKAESRSYSWWGWRRSRAAREAVPSADTVIDVHAPKTEEAKDTTPTNIPNTKIEMSGKT